MVSTATSNSTATKTTKSINIISSFTIPATTSQATTLPASENQKGVEKKPVETPSVKQKGKAKVSYLPISVKIITSLNIFRYCTHHPKRKVEEDRHLKNHHLKQNLLKKTTVMMKKT